jgi:hypothetical protein
VDLEHRIAVFVGPSLPPDRRPGESVFAWLPPAKAGDCYALALARPRAVVLLDGLFDESLAVRHKELLALIAERTPVVGGASMGALRAAELSVFGMIGVGRIFAAFASGRLDGDDEVAIMHGPAEFDFVGLTEPLINVRATILAAVRSRIVDGYTGRRILCEAKRIFYKERTWARLFEDLSRADDVNDAALRAFEDWLPGGRVDLKQEDSLACLVKAVTLKRQPARPTPPETPFTRELRRQALSRLNDAPAFVERR